MLLTRVLGSPLLLDPGDGSVRTREGVSGDGPSAAAPPPLLLLPTLLMRVGEGASLSPARNSSAAERRDAVLSTLARRVLSSESSRK